MQAEHVGLFRRYLGFFFAATILVQIFCPLSLAASKAGELDGTTVEAVEDYLDTSSHRLTTGLGLYPFNAYYNGFSLGLSYTYLFSKSVAWEAVRAEYVYTVRTGLTSELAEDYGVNPDKIEKIDLVVTSNFSYVLAYGKLLLLDRYIKYFRVSGLLGGGIVSTSKKRGLALGLGLHSEFYVNESLSWVIEFRDYFLIPDGNGFPSFFLGFGKSF